MRSAISGDRTARSAGRVIKVAANLPALRAALAKLAGREVPQSKRRRSGGATTKKESNQ